MDKATPGFRQKKIQMAGSFATLYVVMERLSGQNFGCWLRLDLPSGDEIIVAKSLEGSEESAKLWCYVALNASDGISFYPDPINSPK